ncbi:response regulator [Synechocystis sp. LKSZ1]|uniref:hybrid sensor histidine kinase/response regulator n=1 Tax=Synechocystis sp. LKSZ1 TaxID=3144951 RepID=UPI00336BBB60
MSLSPPPVTILVVDDIPSNLEVLSQILRQAGYQIRVEVDGSQVLTQVKMARPDLILLDVMLPGLDGFTVCQQLQAQAETQDIPIIFMTALDQPEDKVRGFRLGAVDYITKPFQEEEVLARVKLHLQLAQLTAKLTQQNQALEKEVAMRTAELFQALQELKETQADLQQAHEELGEYTASLARTNRLKDEFLANMSHELRTPLNSILGLADALGDRCFGPITDQQQEVLTTITQNGHRLLALIESILDLSGLSTGTLCLRCDRVSLRQLCLGALELVETLAQKKGLVLTLELPPALTALYIQGDEARLRQALYHLLHNAVKFTPEGGRVCLRLRLEARENSPDPEHPNWLSLSVEDTGIGISEVEQDSLFQNFIQLSGGLNRSHSGLGLGLALTKQIVRLHGGKVRVHSVTGKGSCFTICLPYGAVAAVETRVAKTHNLLHSTLSPSLVLADSQEADLISLSSYLSAKGHPLQTATSLPEVMALLQKQSAQLLIISSSFLQQVSPALLSLLAAQPVIVLLASPDDLDNVAHLPVQQILPKPIKLRSLETVVSGLLSPNSSTA